MAWIKYDGNKPDTYPKKDGRYKIKRDGKIGFATFNVGWGWAHLITMPDFWFEELTPEQLKKTYPQS